MDLKKFEVTDYSELEEGDLVALMKSGHVLGFVRVAGVTQERVYCDPIDSLTADCGLSGNQARGFYIRIGYQAQPDSYLRMSEKFWGCIRKAWDIAQTEIDSLEVKIEQQEEARTKKISAVIFDIERSRDLAHRERRESHDEGVST